ncbi:hypothetical protein PUN28_018016 [Cardiocondyla obscurior]
MMKTVTIVITSGILVTEVVWQLYKVYISRYRKEAINMTNGSTNGSTKQIYKNTETKLYDVMFFSKDSNLCRSHLGLKLTPCMKLNCAVRYVRRLIQYLDSATDSLDICMYFFTFPDLAKAVINAKHRNVVIRMILDESMTQNDRSQIINFYKEGIQPVSQKLDILMHHKFAIIDNKILISGSINWTKSAFFGNFENVLVTDEVAIVKPFIYEFEKMWTMFSKTASPGLHN